MKPQAVSAPDASPAMTRQYNEDYEPRRTSEKELRKQYRAENETERIDRLHKLAIGKQDNESVLRTARYQF
jgi:hypothetical protein